MSVFRTNSNGIHVKMDSRTVTVAGPAGISTATLAATASAENDRQPVRFEREYLDSLGTRHRVYTRLQQIG